MVKGIILAVILVGFWTTAALAQLPRLGKPGIGKPSPGFDISDLSTSRNKAVSVYLQATQELTISLEKAAEAVGVKEEVLEKLAAVRALNEGNINDKSLEKARKSSEEAKEIIKQKMQETKAPSVESKRLIVESIVHLANGIQKEQELVGEVRNLSDQAQVAVSSASPLEVVKVKDIAGTALTLLKAIPLDLKLTKDILSTYVQYARANNISVPGNATNLLKGD